MGEHNYEKTCNEIYDILWNASEIDLKSLNQEVNKAIKLLEEVITL